MSIYADWREAATALKIYLEEALQEPPHAAAFARWRGVQVLVVDTQGTAPRPTQPQVLINVERDEPSQKVRVASARDALLNIEARANEFTGGVSTRSSEGSDTLLSRALAALLDPQRDDVRLALDAQGFHAGRWLSSREINGSVPGVAQQHVDPHRFAFTYFTSEE